MKYKGMNININRKATMHARRSRFDVGGAIVAIMCVLTLYTSGYSEEITTPNMPPTPTGDVYEQVGATSLSGSSPIREETPFFFLYKGSNNNFTIDSQSVITKKYYTYNYNRFRNDISAGWENKVTFKIILDLENYWGENYIKSPDFQVPMNRELNLPLAPYHTIVTGNSDTIRSYLYRAYSTIYMKNSNLTVGFQRIPFGVGRIWNPTDILNPPNPISIEPGERMGVFGADYIYNFNDLSDVQIFYAEDKDHRTKDWGGRIKTNLQKYDVGLTAIRNGDLKMSGVEVEGELLSTGVGVRTEFGHFESKPLDKEYDKYVLGFDYGFPNSLYIVGEYLFNGNGALARDDYDWTVVTLGSWEQLARSYLGCTMTYELTPLVTLSGSYIRNLIDQSDMFGPAVRWSLADDMDLRVGASLFGGEQYSEFWYYKSVYYMNYGIYF